MPRGAPKDARSEVKKICDSFLDGEIEAARFLADFGKLFAVKNVDSGALGLADFFQNIVKVLNKQTLSQKDKQDILLSIAGNLEQIHGFLRKKRGKSSEDERNFKENRIKSFHINSLQYGKVEEFLRTQKQFELLSKFYGFVLNRYDTIAESLAEGKQGQLSGFVRKASPHTSPAPTPAPQVTPQPAQLEVTGAAVAATAQKPVQLWEKSLLVGLSINALLDSGDSQSANTYFNKHKDVLAGRPELLKELMVKIEAALQAAKFISREEVGSLIVSLKTQSIDKANFHKLLKIFNTPSLVDDPEMLITINELWTEVVRHSVDDSQVGGEEQAAAAAAPEKKRRRSSGSKPNFGVVLNKVYSTKKATKEHTTTAAELKELTRKLPRKIAKLYLKKARAKPENPEILYNLAQHMREQNGYFVKDLAEVRNLLKRAADLNHQQAVFEYVESCIYGIGGAKDLDEAEKYIGKLDEQHRADPTVQFLQGELSFYKREFGAAAKYYARAVEGGDEGRRKNALYSLALLADNQQDKVAIGCLKDLLQNPALSSWVSETLRLSGPQQAAAPNIIRTSQQVCDEYRGKYGEDAKWYLLTTFIYENNRRDKSSEKDAECAVLREALGLLEPEWQDVKAEELKERLIEHEKTSETYFGEQLSDSEQDSDEEDKKHRDQGSPEILQHHAYVEEMLKKVNLQSVLDVIDEINGIPADVVVDKKEEKKYLAKISGVFEKIYDETHTIDSRNKTLLFDLERINFYSAQGKLDEALPQITTQFRVLQVRGIGYKIDTWSQAHRRAYRRRFKQLQKKPQELEQLGQYSRSVYAKAQISYGMEQTEYERYRLKKWAELLRTDLQRILALPCSEETQKALGKKYRTVNDAVQGDYSADYAKHMEHLKHPEIFHLEMRHILYNELPFLVSTGDFPFHPLRYAFGAKYYPGHQGTGNDKENRLRPRYKKLSAGMGEDDGKIVAERPHSGMVFVTLHQLEDYAGKTSNHIPSMNWMSQITLLNEIIHERETSFYAYIPAGSLEYVHFAKFPKTFSSKYHEVYKFKYGLTKELYEKFYQGLMATSPHSTKHRLIQNLLGEYLSAFATAIIYKKASDMCKDDGRVLLFRNNFGGFSLVPTTAVSPTPKGEDYPSRLLLHHTRKRRQQLKLGDSPETSEASEDSDDYDKEKDLVVLKKRKSDSSEIAPSVTDRSTEVGDGDSTTSTSARIEMSSSTSAPPIMDVGHKIEDEPMSEDEEERESRPQVQPVGNASAMIRGREREGFMMGSLGDEKSSSSTYSHK